MSRLIVLKDTVAIDVHTPEVDLRIGVALFRRHPKPLRRFSGVLGNTFAIGVIILAVPNVVR